MINANIENFEDRVKQIDEFVDYVYDFYGPGGINDFGANKGDIAKATFIRVTGNTEVPFEGDSVDREMVRDILLETETYRGKMQ
jgi:hypothetical protein